LCGFQKSPKLFCGLEKHRDVQGRVEVLRDFQRNHSFLGRQTVARSVGEEAGESARRGKRGAFDQKRQEGIRNMLWTGRILSGLSILFLLLDGVMKLFKPAFVVEATVQLGYPESTIVGIGIALV